MIGLSLEKTALRALRRKLETTARALDRAQVAASNRAAVSTRTEFRRRTRKDYALKAADINRRVVLRRGRGANPVATLDISGRHFRLAHFNPRKIKAGVSVKERTGKGRTVHAGAFIARMINSNATGVFRRSGQIHVARVGRYAGRRREKLRQLYGPSPINIWNHHRAHLARFARQRLALELKRQIDYYRNR